MNELVSDWFEVNVGVPQESFLGPLLFIVSLGEWHTTVSPQFAHVEGYMDRSMLKTTKA